MKLAVGTLLSASALVGCVLTPIATPTFQASPVPVATPQATNRTAEPITPQPTDFELVGDTTAIDLVGDLFHETGKPDDRPRYVDIVSIGAAADGLSLNLRMTLRVAPPPARSSSVERLRYYFALDATGDGLIDYVLDLENYSDSRYRSAVETWTAAAPLPPELASSAVTIDDRQVIASVPLASLGRPTSLAFCAFAMSAVPGGDAIFVKDYAPDGWCEGGDRSPVMVPLT